jgi:NAD(P)-dependent dehydrogenase (short-subunit alcohol dehydrogenase family)
MDLRLQGKRVLITAATEGIGLAMAKRFASEGASVTITGRSEDRLNSAASAVMEFGSVQTLLADAGTADGFASIVEQLPVVDVLINNLGVYPLREFFEATDDEWCGIFETNVMSGVRLSRHYLRQMLDAGAGRIIFVSSESGILIPTSTIHYGMTKAAQLAIARGLAELTKGTQVTVNSLLPGPTWSQGAIAFLRGLDLGPADTDEEREVEFFRRVKATSLIQRFIRPEEVADMAAFVASPLSSATNGAAIKVEGGVVPSIT